MDQKYEENYWIRRNRLTRRGFLRGAGLVAGAAALGPVLAACGGGGNKNNAATATSSAAAVANQGAAATKAAKANAVDAVDLTGKKIEVQFWHVQPQGPNGDKLNAIVDAFNSSQPSVTIKPTFQGNYTDLFKKIQASVAAGQVPDLAIAYPNDISEYQSANVVIPLDDYVASTKYGLTPAEQDDYVKAYWDENKYPQYGGKLLSFPFTESVLTMYYNADKLKAANVTKDPGQWTWDDFIAASKAVTSGTTKGYAIGVDASTFDGMVFSRGGKLLSDDLKHWIFNQQPGLDTLSFFEDAVKSGWGYQISKQYADQTDFGAGRAVFALSSSSGIAYYKKEVDGAGKFNWSVAVIPHSPGVSPVTTLYGGSIAAFKTTPEKQLGAWLFMKYFTQPDVTADWSAESGYLPVRKSAVQNEKVQAAIKASPAYGIMVNTIGPDGRAETSVKGTQDTRTAIEDAMTKVLGDPTTNVKQALDTAAQKGDQALEQA